MSEPLLDRRCPNCLCRVPLTRRLFRNPFKPEWRCWRCNSVLRLSGRSPVLTGLLFGGIAYVLLEVVNASTFGSYAAGLLLWGVGSILFLARDRVSVRGCQGFYCSSCGYDLRASPSRCPECGETPTSHSKRGENVRESFEHFAEDTSARESNT